MVEISHCVGIGTGSGRDVVVWLRLTELVVVSRDVALVLPAVPELDVDVIADVGSVLVLAVVVTIVVVELDGSRLLVDPLQLLTSAHGCM